MRGLGRLPQSRSRATAHEGPILASGARKTMAPCVEMSPCVFARAVNLRKREVRCVEALYVGWGGCHRPEALHCMRIVFLIFVALRDKPPLPPKDFPQSFSTMTVSPNHVQSLSTLYTVYSTCVQGRSSVYNGAPSSRRRLHAASLHTGL